jgi:myo-inositol-1(or 4)-monophosphatase
MLTSNLLVDGHLPRWAHRLLTATPWKTRMIGSAAIECVQVGAGIASGALTLNGKLWDVAAAAAVVLAAGGRITDFSGHDVFPIDLTGYSGGKVPFIATSPGMLPALVAELAHRDPVV